MIATMAVLLLVICWGCYVAWVMLSPQAGLRAQLVVAWAVLAALVLLEVVIALLP
jgi:hypothetical protein